MRTIKKENNMGNKKYWNVMSNRYVAFMDIMGFKNMVDREKHQDILQKMITFHQPIEVINNDSEVRLLSKKLTEVSVDEPFTRVITFSDSIIFVTNDGTERSGINICIALDWVMKNAIIMGIPIKGALAYGEQTSDFDMNLHFGRPLIDAFELQEEIMLYGLVFHHTAEKQFQETNMMYNMNHLGYFIWYPVNIKHGVANHFMLNWTRDLSNKTNIELATINKMYDQVSGQPRIYVDNTIKFFDHVKTIEKELNDASKISKE